MTFFYMSKTTTVTHPITKHPARTLELQYFYSVLQKNSVGPDKNGKSGSFPAVISCVWAGLWPAATRTLSSSRSFQTF